MVEQHCSMLAANLDVMICFSIKQTKMAFSSIFEEVPVYIKNSHLVNSLCLELEESGPATEKYNFLDLATRYMLSSVQ